MGRQISEYKHLIHQYPRCTFINTFKTDASLLESKQKSACFSLFVYAALNTMPLMTMYTVFMRGSLVIITQLCSFSLLYGAFYCLSANWFWFYCQQPFH